MTSGRPGEPGEVRRSGRHRPVRKSLLTAIACVLLVFIVYEIVERILLQDVGMDQVHADHLLHALFASVSAAALVAWLVLRASPPLFGSVRAAEQQTPGAPLSEMDRDAHYARWFIQMRWLAVIVATALVYITVGVVGLLPVATWRPLLATIAVLAGVNAAYALLLRRRWAVRHLLRAQAYGDLAILAVLLHYSGGVENPLATLMLFHVIIAGIMLTRRQCYLVAAAGSAAFALLVLAEFAHWVPHYTLGVANAVPAAYVLTYALGGVAVQTAVLFLTAHFTTTVTEQLRRDERQLEVYADHVLSQSQLLEQALETTGTGLRVCDRELQMTWRNSRWDGWFGDRGASTPGEASRLASRQTLQDGEVRITEVSRQDGRSAAGGKIFQITTAPVVNKDGDKTHVVQLVRDITEEKQIQAQMVRTEKLAAVGELAGRLAHEVNNPIAIISAKARLLLADPRAQLSDRTATELTKVTELADRVARIAQGLLSYCRSAPGQATMLDLCIPIRKAIAIIEPAAVRAAVRVEAFLLEPLPWVRANAGEMEQVFLNLFLNALDAMPDGGCLSITAEREVSADDGVSSVVVGIEDTGYGMPAEVQERVFEPFFTTKPEGKGTGLGLSICLGLMRSNGGEIALESEPGRGTRVRLRMPVHRMPDQEIADG
jgi:signal transduction histidine kinase